MPKKINRFAIGNPTQPAIPQIRIARLLMQVSAMRLAMKRIRIAMIATPLAMRTRIRIVPVPMTRIRRGVVSAAMETDGMPIVVTNDAILVPTVATT
jgi:hypothetical protein